METASPGAGPGQRCDLGRVRRGQGLNIVLRASSDLRLFQVFHDQLVNVLVDGRVALVILNQLLAALELFVDLVELLLQGALVIECHFRQCFVLLADVVVQV